MKCRGAHPFDGSAACRDDIASVAVIGAGTAGVNIAMRYLNACIPVTLLEKNRAGLEAGVAHIRRTYQALVEERKLPAYKYAVRMAFLSTSLNSADLASADLVIDSSIDRTEMRPARHGDH